MEASSSDEELGTNQLCEGLSPLLVCNVTLLIFIWHSLNFMAMILRMLSRLHLYYLRRKMSSTSLLQRRIGRVLQ